MEAPECGSGELTPQPLIKNPGRMEATSWLFLYIELIELLLLLGGSRSLSHYLERVSSGWKVKRGGC
jgi:hypothetical protein